MILPKKFLPCVAEQLPMLARGRAATRVRSSGLAFLSPITVLKSSECRITERSG